ncbi:MAG TPA: gamma-glutamylcyclotransferase family protein [Pyrinomonadaceae bacterium]|nr:gamma-glutamylcyclotransferase family protein [Pyrinomonadaceae bacterium]
MRHLIFIYGSLRRGSPGSILLRFPRAEFIAETKVRGDLYDLGAYPGLQLSYSDSLVSGELYEIDEETLKLLDEFEESSNYRRAQFEISLGAETRQCWTYEPYPSFYSLRKLITSGDWIEYSKARTPADQAGL